MTLSGLEEEIALSVERVSESVASIDATIHAKRNRFGQVIPIEGSGSGLLFDSLGHVITNNHVVDSADMVRVTLRNGTVLKGSVLGADRATDIAVIRLNPLDQNVPQATLGDSERLRVGQIALAVGNSLGLPGGPTVSLGVISALGRPLPGADFIYEGFIQTDAAVNPGNSGGPLSNLQGEVIGINTAIIPYANGMGFAIPINMVKHVVDQILQKGRVIRPWIGISAVDVTSSIARRYDLGVEKGVVIVSVSRYSPADEAGLRQMDVILNVNGHEINKMKDLITDLSKIEVGSGVNLTISRLGREREVSARLIEMPTRLIQDR